MKIITQPATEPITLAEVKTQLGIKTADTLSDATITRRIKEARLFAEKYCQRAIITQTQEVRQDCFPASSGAIKLPYPNLLSIVSIKYIDTDGVEQTWPSSNYAIDNYKLIGSVAPVYGVSWPSTRGESNAVRIQYTCGYGPAASDVPDLLREAILLLVGHWMNFQPQAESGVVVSRVPYGVLDHLDQFRVMEFV